MIEIVAFIFFVFFTAVTIIQSIFVKHSKALLRNNSTSLLRPAMLDIHRKNKVIQWILVTITIISLLVFIFADILIN